MVFRNQINGGKNKMGTSFQYSKNLACEGAILMTLTIIPYVGWVLGIIGVFLLLRGLKELSGYYQDTDIYKNSLTGLKYYIVAIIAAAVAIPAMMIGLASVSLIPDFPGFGAVGFAAGIAITLAAIVIAFIFYILAASNLKKALNTLAQKSGEHSFETAATFLWIGAILTIVFGLGLLLMLVAWIFVVVGFFSMKPPAGTYQPNGYTAQQAQATTTQTARYCPHCGAPVASDATYCAHCGKQLST
ncbi:MAG: DUF996 domain-containing protein [Candidatus Bathyarchaeota archaeon]|nr:DUF996 domain-containing protein [Candidatus Bathyarchaeota archaeon]